MFDVYCITSPSGRHYVGMTSYSAEHRWRQHVSEARAGSNKRISRAIRKYGPDAFTHELLERMSTEAGAKRAEQLWIARLGSFGPGGYNLTLGGEGVRGHTHTAESIRRISEALRGRVAWNTGIPLTPEQRRKISASLRGKKHSPETRSKMSESRRGHRHSAETRARIGAANAAPELWARLTDAERSAFVERRARAKAQAKGSRRGR